MGLVTFTSVRRTPITSRPTSSTSRAANVGQRASAISRYHSDSGKATLLTLSAKAAAHLVALRVALLPERHKLVIDDQHEFVAS